jgi:hypothetical protein
MIKMNNIVKTLPIYAILVPLELFFITNLLVKFLNWSLKKRVAEAFLPPCLFIATSNTAVTAKSSAIIVGVESSGKVGVAVESFVEVGANVSVEVTGGLLVGDGLGVVV